MSGSDPKGEAPGGLSWARFKAISAETGLWVWGTAQGAFNEKASFDQILVDAVIGMIPLAGDVTAVRDLIAVTMGLVDSPQKRDEYLEWVLFVVLLFALIPVFGGVVKGVGRILVKVSKESAAMTGAAKAAHMAEGAKEIMAFLNRIGWKNAEKWFLALRAADHQAELLKHFNAFIDVFSSVLMQFTKKVGALLPSSLIARIKGLLNGLADLKKKGAEMIPKAVKELDQKLKEMQAFVRSGGETTSRTVAHEVATGERGITRAQEARLIEDGALPVRSAKGWAKNTAVEGRPETYAHVYKHEPGYPDLTARVEDGHYTGIEAFSGKIINRELKPGEKLYRIFGPEGTTHRIDVAQSYPGGGWWGLGSPPKTAKEWRVPTAVLDEWNRDGFMVVGKVPKDSHIKAAVGTVSEQYGQKIPGQYLPGGAQQAAIDMSKDAKTGLSQVAEEVMKSGKSGTWVDPTTGMKFEVRPTGWTDANGVHGYIETPGTGTVKTDRLGAQEMASKENKEVTK